jgi:hypothetical protein
MRSRVASSRGWLRASPRLRYSTSPSRRAASSIPSQGTSSGSASPKSKSWPAVTHPGGLPGDASDGSRHHHRKLTRARSGSRRPSPATTTKASARPWPPAGMAYPASTVGGIRPRMAKHHDRSGERPVRGPDALAQLRLGQPVARSGASRWNLAATDDRSMSAPYRYRWFIPPTSGSETEPVSLDDR